MTALLPFLIFFAAAAFAQRRAADTADAVPFVTGVTLIVLYAASFFRALAPAAVLLQLLFFVYILITVYRHPREYVRGLADPVVLTAAALMILAAALSAGRVITWWDDINFWANDAKALWAVGGFADKYANVSPEFGDYPPMEALWKWVFLSASSDVYMEGLQLAAFYTLNMIFLLPLAKRTGRFRHPMLRICTAAAVFLIPGAVCGLQFDGAAADVTMGAAFAALLLALTETPDEPEAVRFRAARIAVYAAVLSLVKSTGFMWVLTALIFALFVLKRRAPWKRFLLTALLPAAVWGSWLARCLIYRRVARVTGDGIRMVRNGVGMPDNAAEKFRVFLEAFFTWPLHSDTNPTVDLSAAGFLAVLLFLGFALYRIRKTEHMELPVAPVRLFLFVFLTGLLSYGAVMAAHLTVFVTEDQYFDPFAMTRSISRYAAPWTIGMIALFLALLSEAVTEDLSKRMTALLAAIFLGIPLLTADYAGESRAFISWRQTLAEDLENRAAAIDEAGARFLSDMEGRTDLYGKGRVLLFKDGQTDHRVRDTYLSYAASPISVVYGDFDPSMTREQIEETINASHATEVYVDAPLREAYGAIMGKD